MASCKEQTFSLASRVALPGGCRPKEVPPDYPQGRCDQGIKNGRVPERCRFKARLD